LDELYDLSISHLRDSMIDEYWLHDARPISDEKFHEVLLLKRRREVLEFDVARPQEYIEEIERQIVNHHRLLWGLIDFLGDLIRQSRYYDVQIWRLIATAIGQIGEVRKNRLDAVLNKLASHPQGHVASSVAFTLSYLARNVNNHPFILEILGNWIKSKQYDYLWAAIVAISPIYEIISQIATRPSSADATVLSEARVAQNTLTELQKWLTEACVATNNFDTSQLEKITRHTIIQAVQETLKETEDDEVPSPVEIKKLIDQEVSKRVTVRKMAMADQLGMAIIRTIQQISQNSPDDMVNLLKEWLTRETSTLDWQLGRMTINYLFQMTVESKVQVIEERHLQLLGLLPAMLDASINIGTDMNKMLLTLFLGSAMAEENIHHNTAEMLGLINQTPIHTAVKTLATWYDYLSAMNEADIENQDNIWRAQVYPALLHLVNVSHQRTRPMLIDALIACWLDCPHDEVRRSAMALLTRCYIMDGVVLALPVQQYGVVLVDAGESANKHYYGWIFDILQRLATLTPLRIYHLGWIGRWQMADEKSFANSTPLHLGRFEAESVDFGTIRKDDLHLDFSRPRLLMPLIHNPSLNFLPITAEASHFILSLNRGDIHDLPEFVDSLLGNIQAPKEYNPFLEALQASKDKNIDKDTGKDKSPAPQPTWEWFGKLFLLGNPSPLLEKLPVGALQWLGVPKEFNTVVARNIELRVQQQIITELHAINTTVWHNQLALYRQKENDIPLQKDQDVSQEDQNALWQKLDEWVTQLDIVPETIPPRDVTLTIGSTILLWSRIDLIKTTEKVHEWLISGDPVKAQIGKACTKILFNFYRQGANWDDVQALSPLLTLFPPFMQLEPGFAEFNGIIQTVLDWAKNKRWSERLLVTEDGTVSEFIRGIAYIEDKDDADRTMNQLIVRETLLRLQTLFIDVGEGFLQFIELVNETIRWAIEEQVRRQRAIQEAQNAARRGSGGRGRRSNIQPKSMTVKYQPSAPPKGISSDFANELLELPNLNEQFRDAVLAEIANQEDWLLSHRKEHREIRVNVQTVLDSIRLQLYSKRDGDLPPLPKDKDVSYGVVLLDVSGRDHSMRERLPNFAIRLLGGILSEANGKVLTIVHRLGRQEMVAILEPKARKTTLKPDDLLPKGLPYYAPIIGPILERYTPDQTQFVAIITNKPLADWQDFVDDDTWAGRLFVISEQSFTMPMGIERLPIPSEDAQKDPFKEIAKDILRRTTRRK
ncbi:MAG: hypothetical protein SH821_16975, partial [Phototrophicales bacterium]|nr:hypothetical protein [Phototrophicales bacterium]